MALILKARASKPTRLLRRWRVVCRQHVVGILLLRVGARATLGAHACGAPSWRVRLAIIHEQPRAAAVKVGRARLLIPRARRAEADRLPLAWCRAKTGQIVFVLLLDGGLRRLPQCAAESPSPSHRAPRLLLGMVELRVERVTGARIRARLVLARRRDPAVHRAILQREAHFGHTAVGRHDERAARRTEAER
eukprot:6965543-Prymnesium_polylepis.1